jgi:sulfofructose kinase
VAIARLGVDVRFVGVIDGELEGVEVERQPGQMVESTILVGHGTRAIITTEADPFEVSPESLDGAEWVHVDQVGHRSLRPLLHEVATRSRISVDGSNPIPDLELDDIHLYAPSDQTDDGRRARLTVVTKGENGCTAYTNGETVDIPGFPVEAVSTLGAGDVFHGALLACLARGLPLRDSLVRANACAALSCLALDGRSAIPTWDELEASVR